MRRQQALRLVVPILVVAVLLAACGAPKPAQPTAQRAATAAPSTPVELTLWCVTYQPYVDGFNAMIEEFRKTHPNVTFKIETYAWAQFWTKITAAVAAGTGPDIAHLYSGDMFRLVAEGVLLPLEPGDFPLDKMSPMVKQSVVKGKLWAVPMAVRTFGYFYNPDLYAKAGVANPPARWDEEIPIAEKLTQFDKDGKFAVIGEGLWPKAEGWTIWQLRCVQFGGSYISQDLRKMTWDDPAAVAAFEFMTSKMTKHKIFTDGFHDSWITAFADGVEAGFIGNVGMIGALRGQKQPWKAAPMPAGPKSDVTLGNFWPLGITQQVKGAKLAAAIEFLKFAASPEGNRAWCRKTGDIPSLLEVAAEKEFAESEIAPFVKGAANSVFVFDPSSVATRAGWEAAWDKVVLKGADPKTALLEGMPQAQEVLDDFWRKMDAMK